MAYDTFLAFLPHGALNGEYNISDISPMQETTEHDLSDLDPEFLKLWLCLKDTNRLNNSYQETNTSCDHSGFKGGRVSYGNSAEYDILKSNAYAMTIILCYIIVISFGALGNIMVVLTVIKAKKMWNATNIFIANLAVADIFVCVFDLPLSAYYQITGQWIFGATLCRIIPMVFAMVVYSSTLTLTMIAIDRYILVVHPLKTKMTLKAAFIFIFLIAIISSAVALPIAVYGHYQIYDDRTLNVYRQLCFELWPTITHRRVYTILTLLFQYFIPLVVIGVLYVRIFLKIRIRMRTKRCSRRTKTTKMLVAVVTVFAITWTPYHIHSILSEYGINPFGIYYKFVDSLLRVIAMSSSCLNPFLYGWLNENYKNAFLSIVRKPTGTPMGIHREESDRTMTRSNCHPSPSPVSQRKCVNNHQKDNDESNAKCHGTFLEPPERVPLRKLEQNGGGRGGAKKCNGYQSVAEVANDPKSPVVIVVILHDDDTRKADRDKENNNIESGV